MARFWQIILAGTLPKLSYTLNASFYLEAHDAAFPRFCDAQFDELIKNGITELLFFHLVMYQGKKVNRVFLIPTNHTHPSRKCSYSRISFATVVPL